MKQFLIEEAARCGVGICAIGMRLSRGRYEITLERINKRRINVIGTPVYIGKIANNAKLKTNKLTSRQQSDNFRSNMSNAPTKESELSPEAQALLREEKSRGGKAGSRADKSKAGKLGYLAKLKRLEEKAKRAMAKAALPKPTALLTIIICGTHREVPRDIYVTAKTKQLVEFGYPTLTEAEVDAQIDAVLDGKTHGNGLTVIGAFMKDEIVVEKKAPSGGSKTF
jgi:hypothetical protein